MTDDGSPRALVLALARLLLGACPASAQPTRIPPIGHLRPTEVLAFADV